MQVIHAVHDDGRQISKEQFHQDLPKLKELHKNALKKEITWEFFGGLLYIEDREYQVA